MRNESMAASERSPAPPPSAGDKQQKPVAMSEQEARAKLGECMLKSTSGM